MLGRAFRCCSLAALPLIAALAACAQGSEGDAKSGAMLTGPGAPPTSAPADPTQACGEHQADFDTLLTKVKSQLTRQHIPGASIAILCQGKRIFSAGVGVTKEGGSAAVAATTRFQAASITKTLTATAALRLVERGAIKLDAPVRDAISGLDGASPYDRPFTWAELLSHTSGFPTDLEEDELDLAKRVAKHAHEPLWAPPGAVFNYSNEGYDVAGFGLESVAQKPIRELIEAEVMVPAGMTNATMDPDKVENDGAHAIGHSGDGSSIGPTSTYLGTTYYAPMGGAWLAAEDLVKFAGALMAADGTLLQKASVDAMTKPRTRAWPGVSYGLGIEVADHGDGLIEWTHDGSVQGFGSLLAIFPSDGFAFAVMWNSDEGHIDLENEAFEAFTGKALAQPRLERPASSDLEEEAGTYESSALGTLTVAKNGSSLELTIANENRTVRLESEGARYTYSFDTKDGFPVDATFWRDASTGKIRFLATGLGVGERRE